METEFVNVFIQKQKALIDDLISKNLILDARLTIAEKTAGELGNKVLAQQEQITSLTEKKSKTTTQ